MAEVDDILTEILRLRGAEYVCLADRASGIIIGEAGHGESLMLAGDVVKLETMVSNLFGSGSDDELEDLMISFRYRYHLIRHVESADHPPLLLYLRLKRNRANLAVARRELASVELNNHLVDILRSPNGRDHESTDPLLPPLPHRAPASSPAEREYEPEPNEPTELPPVLRQRWSFDRNTMERLVDGLRRMMF
jgi:hypothetical protein